MTELETSIAENRTAVNEFVATARALDGPRWTTPRAPGAWTPAQIVEHVAIVYEYSRDILLGKPQSSPLPGFLRPLLRWFVVDSALKAGTFTRKGKAPGFLKPVAPAPPSLAEAIQRARGGGDRFRSRDPIGPSGGAPFRGASVLRKGRDDGLSPLPGDPHAPSPRAVDVDVGLVQVRHRPAPEQLHRPRDISAQNFQRARDAGSAGGAEAVGIRTADQHRARAETQRLHHVAAAPHTAVEQHVDSPSDSVDHLRQDLDRRAHAVKLPAAVVGARRWRWPLRRRRDGHPRPCGRL